MGDATDGGGGPVDMVRSLRLTQMRLIEESILSSLYTSLARTYSAVPRSTSRVFIESSGGCSFALVLEDFECKVQVDLYNFAADDSVVGIPSFDGQIAPAVNEAKHRLDSRCEDKRTCRVFMLNAFRDAQEGVAKAQVWRALPVKRIKNGRDRVRG